MLLKLMRVLLGLILTTVGIKILSDNSLTFGGTAGISSVLTFATNYSWGLLFFIVNIPFFYISLTKIGKRFSLSSLLSITFISIAREFLDLLSIPSLPSVYASILAGIIIGIGVTFVLNNGSSLGGIHILALYMDNQFKINRGIIIFVSDSLIILFASIMVGWQRAAISILSIAIASIIIGRYKKSPIRNVIKEEGYTPVSASNN